MMRLFCPVKGIQVIWNFRKEQELLTEPVCHNFLIATRKLRVIFGANTDFR